MPKWYEKKFLEEIQQNNKLSDRRSSRARRNKGKTPQYSSVRSTKRKSLLEPIAEEDQSQRYTEDTMKNLAQMRREISESKQSRMQSASHEKPPSSWVEYVQETCSNGVCYLKNRLGLALGTRKNKTHKNSKSHNKTKHHKKHNMNQSRKRRHTQKKH